MLKIARRNSFSIRNILRVRGKNQNTRNYSKEKEKEIDLDEPIKFTSSPAAKWAESAQRSGGNKGAISKPWYQPYVVMACAAAFMLHFFYLREENDIDQSMDNSIFDTLRGVNDAKGSNLKVVAPKGIKQE